MQDWAGIFSTYLNTGVYLAAPGADADIRSAALSCDLEYIEVDLKVLRISRVSSKKLLIFWASPLISARTGTR